VAESIDNRIQALADRQRGHVKRRQLLALGLTRHGIAHRVKSRRLIQVHAGVYAVGHVPALPEDRAYGSLLACGPKAVLSHGSAATVYGIRRRWDMPFEVTVPSKRRPHGISVHRAALTRTDTGMRLGLRVTSPARTLLDMAPRLTDKQLRRAFNTLRLSHHLRPEQLADVIGRFQGHPGAPRLTPLAETRGNPTRSNLEDKFVDFCATWGLPEPLLNVHVAGREVDAFFPEARLIVELDGTEVHSGHVSFEDDRDRDASMLELGLATVRMTEERIDHAPAREAARLLAIVRARSEAA
jgi:AbiEi antitoxin C-terminal domain